MESKPKILFVEDDPYLGTIIKDLLGIEGYNIQFFYQAENALDYYLKNKVDLCIFDVMLPGMDGFELARKVRVIDKNVPILFLTARAQKEDVLEGFVTGGDDYLKKPFVMEELVVRIKALLRRTGQNVQNQSLPEKFEFGRYHFDAKNKLLTYSGSDHFLTHRESEMLRLFCLNLNQLVERKLILEAVWEDDSYFNARSMDVFLAKLRKHFRNDPNVSLVNVRGRGFKLLVNSSS